MSPPPAAGTTNSQHRGGTRILKIRNNNKQNVHERCAIAEFIVVLKATLCVNQERSQGGHEGNKLGYRCNVGVKFNITEIVVCKL